MAGITSSHRLFSRWISRNLNRVTRPTRIQAHKHAIRYRHRVFLATGIDSTHHVDTSRMGSDRRLDFDQYLDRIDLPPDRRSRADWDLLVELQRRHLFTVPFTNVFVRDGHGTSLDPHVVVPRIAAGGGGLCYDLNGAFAWLLDAFGFDVALCSARPMREDGSYGTEFDHLALLVDDHLIDVGFGDFARQPVPINGNARSDVSGTYRVAEVDDEYAVQARADDGWRDKYRFDTTPRAPEEFAEMTDYHATSSDSPFTGDLLATLPTEDGRITLSGTSITTTERSTHRKQHVPLAQLDAVLRERFGITISDG